MKLRLALPLLVITALLGSTTQASAQLSSDKPITIDINLSPEASFAAVGERAGVNIIVGPYSKKSTIPVPFNAENRSVPEVLDLLSKQTGTFWTTWDDKTILVFEDNAQNRRDYERQLLKRIALDRPAEQVLQELRDKQGLRGLAVSGNAIVLRDTAARIRQAEELLGKPVTAPSDGELAHTYLTEIGAPYRTPDLVRSQLKIKPPGSVSFNVTESVRTTYETLARMVGLNVVFPGTFPTRSHSLRLANVDYFEALDLLSVETRSFWQPINDTTIMVMEDTQQNRRDFQSQLIETIYLSPGTSPQKLNEITSSLRNLLSLRGVYQSEPASAIVLKDTASNALLTETLIEAMSGASIRKEAAAGILDAFSESGGPLRTPTDLRSSLKMKAAGKISLRMNAPVSDIFEHLATIAGLDLLFASPARNMSIDVEGLDIVDVLDLVAVQSRTFWQPLDTRTIQVLEDTQQNRRDFANHTFKTFYLPAATSTVELNTIMNVLRTSMSLRGIYQYEGARAIVMHDTPSRVELAEKLIRQLNTKPEPITSVVMSSRGVTETAARGTSSVARSELRVPSIAISLNLVQERRATYEALAQMAGLRVTFDARMAGGGPIAFRLNGVDTLEALDYLALQTRTFWKVVDDHTILVAPDTQQAHVEYDTRFSKTFVLTNAKGTNATTGILNVLRTAMSLREVVAKSPGVIEVLDTPERLALVEEIIASLDIVR